MTGVSDTFYKDFSINQWEKIFCTKSEWVRATGGEHDGIPHHAPARFLMQHKLTCDSQLCDATLGHLRCGIASRRVACPLRHMTLRVRSSRLGTGPNCIDHTQEARIAHTSSAHALRARKMPWKRLGGMRRVPLCRVLLLLNVLCACLQATCRLSLQPAT